MKFVKIYIYILLFTFSNVIFSQDIIGNVATEGTLKLSLYNTTRLAVARYTSGVWQNQWYFGTAKSYLLDVNGTSYGGANAGGYYIGDLGWSTCVNTPVDANNIYQIATRTGVVSVKQTLYYPANSSNVIYTWEITNLSGATLNNLKFYSAGDTYLAGGDNGEGYWNGTTNTVGVTKTVSGTFVNLYLQATGSEVPFQHESDLYSTLNSNVQPTNALNGVVNAVSHDNGIGLEWRKASLAAGAVWTITAEEYFASKLVTGLTVVAPVGETIEAGQTKNITYTVTNTTGSTINTISLAELMNIGTWSGIITSPVGTFSLAAGASQSVTVSVTCPVAEPVGTVCQGLLTATYGASNANDVAYITVIAPTCTGTLSSAVGTNAQTKCANTAITNITYTTASATGITSTGLPTGVTAAWAANVITISGTIDPAASGLYSYTITLTGGTCAGQTVTGTITVTPITAISAQSTGTQTACITTGTFSAMTVTASGSGLTYQWYSVGSAATTGGTSLGSANGAQTASYTPQSGSAGTLYYYCIVTGTCATATTAGSGAIITSAATAISAQSTATQTQCITTGTFTAMTVTASGGGLTYQWYSRPTVGTSGGTSLGSANGAQTASYTPPTTTAGTLYYYCVVTGTCASATTAASGAIITSAATAISAQSTTTQTQCITTGTFSPMTVTASGGGLTYQWYSVGSAATTGGTSLGSANGAQTASYTPTATVAGTLYYYCIVTGTCASATTAASGAIITSAATAISAQSTTTQTQCITSGTFSPMTVTATGGGLTYQWYSVGSAVTSGGTSLGSANGAQTASYTPPTTVAGTLFYYCIVSGTCATATTAASGAIITSAATAISSQSTLTETNCTGGGLTALSVTATGGGLTYQWYSNSIASTVAGALLVGANASSYTPSDAVIGTLYYYCIVSGTCSSATSAISGAIIVTSGTSLVSQTTPTETDCIGGGLTALSVTATGTTLTYQWFSNSVTSTSAGTLLVGATSSTYTPSDAVAGTLYYYCVISGACGNVTSAISGAIIINPNTSLTSQITPTETDCISGGLTALTVTAAGTGLTYQWYSNTISSTVGGTLLAGATSSTYIPSDAVAGTLYYFCIINGTCSNVTSAVSGAIIVNPASSISAQSTVTQTVCELGTFSSISVTAIGVGLTYQWYSNSSATNSGGLIIAGATSSMYSPSAAVAGTLYYYCVITGTCGNVTSAISGAMIVNPSTAISSQSTASQTVCEAGVFSPISLVAIGSGLTYQWYSNATASNSGGTLIVGATSASYVPLSSVVGTTYYYCEITGTCANSTSPVSGAIVVNTATTITSQSTATESVCASAIFSPLTVTAIGSTLTYQWYSNSVASNTGGTIIAGATLATYMPSSLVGVTTYYYCVASGACSSDTSAISGALIINPLPTALLTSLTATNSQIVCINTAITNITYAVNGNTSITVSGLPPGIVGNYFGGVYTIDGIATTAGSFNYIVTVTGLCSPVFTVNGSITVNPLPTVTLTSALATSTQQVCVNSPINSITYAIGGTATGATIIGLPTGVSSSYSAGVLTVTGIPSTAAMYSYSIVTTGGCNPASTVTGSINVIALPVVASITGPSTVCLGSTINLSDATSSGVWTSSLPAIAPVNGSGVVSGSALGSSVISYTVTVNGCSSASTSTVQVLAMPTVASITGPTTVCQIDTMLLSNITPSGIWNSNNNSVAIINSNGEVVGITPGTAIMSYSVTNNGCLTASSVMITVLSLPIVLPITGINTVCQDLTTTLYDLTSSGAWLSTNPLIASINSSTGVVTGVSSGTVLMNYTVSSAGCSTTENILVTVNPTPVIAVITGTPKVCIGSMTSLYDATASGIWSSNSATIATISSTGIVTGVSAGTSIIDYEVSVLGCIGKQSVTITVGVLPTSPLNSGDSTYCSNTNLSDMTAFASIGGTLTWYSDSTILDEIGVGTTATPSNEKGIRMYYITETLNGCEGLPSSIRITIEDCGVEIFTAFTPDNDGINDKWILPNIDTKFPKNVVSIYNRWGQLIFQSPQGKYSSNPWDGTYEGKSLPVDSYYYVIEYNDDYTASSKGNISIIIK